MGYYKYGGIYVDTEETSNRKCIVHESNNLANPHKMVVGLLNANGTINTASSTARTTDFIPCSAGDVITAGLIKKYARNPFVVVDDFFKYFRACVFFDSNRNYISNINEITTTTVIAPLNSKYVRFSFATYNTVNPATNPEKVFVYVSEEEQTEPSLYFDNGIEYLETFDTASLEHWGETWTMFGDSLTDAYAGHSWDEETSPVGGEGWKEDEDPLAVGSRRPWTGFFWGTTIARNHGFTIDNQAHGGSNIYNSRVYNDTSGVHVLDEWINKLHNGEVEMPSLITIGYGSNSVLDEIGNPTDEPSNTTMSLYAGVKYFIETLNRECPNSRKVYILHPLQTGWRDTDGKAREAMRKVFESYNVEYVDMSKASGITTDMLPDGLHVSSIEANRQYGRFLESYLF